MEVRALNRFTIALTLLGLACGRTNAGRTESPILASVPRGAAASQLLVQTTNYQTGALREIDLKGEALSGARVPIHADAVVRKFPQSGYVWVVNRLGQDNIQVILPDLSRTVAQVSVGRTTNPQDIALINDDAAYVTRLKSRTLHKINPRRTDRRTRQAVVYSDIDLSNPFGVDLSGAPDPDGNPEMTYMKQVGPYLLIELERLNAFVNYAPTGKSLLAVLDTRTDRVERYQLLQHANPVTDFKTGPDGALYLGEMGSATLEPRRAGRTVLDGGIERLNPTSFASEGLVVDSAHLGGDIVDFEVVGPDSIVASVAHLNTQLVHYQPSTGQTRVLLTSGGYSFTQVVMDRARGVLYVADRDPRVPRIRVIDATTLRERPDPGWHFDLPPFQMLLAD